MMIVLACLLGLFGVAGLILYFLIGRDRYGGKEAALLQLGATDRALRNGSLNPEPCRTIRVYFIKPSRYDEEGYVSVFRFGVQPNNTLTVLNALNDTYNRRHSAASNVYLNTVIWDEICDGVVSPETIRAIKEK